MVSPTAVDSARMPAAALRRAARHWGPGIAEGQARKRRFEIRFGIALDRLCPDYVELPIVELDRAAHQRLALEEHAHWQIGTWQQGVGITLQHEFQAEADAPGRHVGCGGVADLDQRLRAARIELASGRIGHAGALAQRKCRGQPFDFQIIGEADAGELARGGVGRQCVHILARLREMERGVGRGGPQLQLGSPIAVPVGAVTVEPGDAVRLDQRFRTIAAMADQDRHAGGAAGRDPEGRCWLYGAGADFGAGTGKQSARAEVGVAACATGLRAHPGECARRARQRAYRHGSGGWVRFGDAPSAQRNGSLAGDGVGRFVGRDPGATVAGGVAGDLPCDDGGRGDPWHGRCAGAAGRTRHRAVGADAGRGDCVRPAPAGVAGVRDGGRVRAVPRLCAWPRIA
ncbi:unnamed protein product, partial [Rhizophagus irregularis]